MKKYHKLSLLSNIAISFYKEILHEIFGTILSIYIFIFYDIITEDSQYYII